VCVCVCVCVRRTYQGSYPNAKKLNVSEFELVPDPHFNHIPVNLTESTVHVPTNVYDNCTLLSTLLRAFIIILYAQ